MKDSLNVQIYGNHSGDITFEDTEYIYHYITEDKKSFLSLTMPTRSKDYLHNNLHPIFEMHLPEGYLLSIIKKHFSKIVDTNDFGLLKLMSPFIKGRITYVSNEDNNTALNLLGSKKWWDKKFLIRFGKESCDLTQKEASLYYDECLMAVNEVSKEIKIKQKSASGAKEEFLEGLLNKFNN